MSEFMASVFYGINFCTIIEFLFSHYFGILLDMTPFKGPILYHQVSVISHYKPF